MDRRESTSRGNGSESGAGNSSRRPSTPRPSQLPSGDHNTVTSTNSRHATTTSRRGAESNYQNTSSESTILESRFYESGAPLFQGPRSHGHGLVSTSSLRPSSAPQEEAMREKWSDEFGNPIPKPDIFIEGENKEWACDCGCGLAHNSTRAELLAHASPGLLEAFRRDCRNSRRGAVDHGRPSSRQ